MFWIHNAKIYQAGAFCSGSVRVENGRVAALAFGVDGQKCAATATADDFDAHGARLVPGFIDVHTHGGDGVDVNAANAEALLKIADFFAGNGTTAWLASVLTDTEEQTLWCIAQIKEAMARQAAGAGGARLLGVHLEGPFLACEYKGAMPESLLKKASRALFDRYWQAAAGCLRTITVAPEVDGVMELIPYMVAKGVRVAIGHSAAGYDCAMESITRGATCCTHLGNAMRIFHQHEPAIFGAALASDIYCEAICDGFHLHHGTVQLYLKAKGPKRVVAVTDCIMAAGLPDGEYTLGVNAVTVSGGDAKLSGTNIRAGSTLTTKRALQKLLEFTGGDWASALPPLTENPAEFLGLGHQKGRVAAGCDADFVLLGEDGEALATWIAGLLARPKDVFTAKD